MRWSPNAKWQVQRQLVRQGVNEELQVQVATYRQSQKSLLWYAQRIPILSLYHRDHSNVSSST